MKSNNCTGIPAAAGRDYIEQMTGMASLFFPVAWVFVVLSLTVLATPAATGADDLPYYLEDRGRGVPTSLFGTYIEKSQVLVYPFYEYTYNSAEEYSPSELGFGGPGSADEYDGTSETHEALLFLGYGITDWLAVELEGALYTSKSLEKSDADSSNMPNELTESGLGDVEAQLRWRYSQETEKVPEFFSWFQVVFPFQKDDVLIGTQDWEFAFGFGAIKGFTWGTITLRASILYEQVDESIQSGEYAVEYLKKLSPSWKVYAAIEGEEDEVSAIGEAQYSITNSIVVKFGSGFGLTEKAPDFAPEVGVLFVF